MTGMVVANVNLKPKWRARLDNERKRADDRWKAKQARDEALKANFKPVSWDFLPTK